ncbi:hypothetical protein G5I_11659 [Acromyrmex echinatior]|uniref:Uncharacterized protein n=1 Tax=Acromyrmex echinatior TaxID=103372 RepID=F4X0A2_ACREC|nr:hypothetical protein G5I_11659 [Acromyrmex echinatior]
MRAPEIEAQKAESVWIQTGIERSGSDKREEIPRSKRSTSVERTNGNRFGIGMLPMQALQTAGAGDDWSSFTKWISRIHKAGEKIVKRYALALPLRYHSSDVRHAEDERVNRRLVIRYRHNDARSRRNTYFKNANLLRSCLTFFTVVISKLLILHYTGHGGECGWRARREKDDEELRLADIQRRAYNDLCRL